MNEVIKINKEISGKNSHGEKYRVKNLKFDTNKSILYGTIFMKKLNLDFYIDFGTDAVRAVATKDEELNDALISFLSNHIVYFKNNEKDTNKNIHVEKTIKII